MIADDLTIARKPKVNSEALANGAVNGVASTNNGIGSKRKRSADEASIDPQEQVSKRGKVKEASSNGDDLVVLDDAGDGAIVVDDD